jgi:hypothetical protein
MANQLANVAAAPSRSSRIRDQFETHGGGSSFLDAHHPFNVCATNQSTAGGHRQMTRLILFVVTILIASEAPLSAQEMLEGTWKLISSQRINLATGVTTDTLGPDPQGFVIYTREGHMMVLITQRERPRAASIDKISSADRERLFSSMLAYTGTYTFDGKTIEHHIDLSWNEVWSNTTQIRDVRKDGDRLIYTTRPAPSPVDGSMGVATVIWEKVK